MFKLECQQVFEDVNGKEHVLDWQEVKTVTPVISRLESVQEAICAVMMGYPSMLLKKEHSKSKWRVVEYTEKMSAELSLPHEFVRQI